MTTDSALIKASLSEPASFGDLYRRHAAPVFRYAARRLDRQAAEDVLSQTFVVAFTKRTRFDHSWESALPWLLGIATREIARHRTVEARAWEAVQRSDYGVTEAEDVSAAISQRLDARAAVRQLGGALRTLPERDRDVLLLHAWADLDYAGIATALDIPIGTVRSRLNRARRILRAAQTSLIRPDSGEDDERPDTAPHTA